MKIKNAFSLMEMMIVLLIVAIVAAASAPIINRKVISATSEKSPWVWTGLSGNITYNPNGLDRTAAIGAFGPKGSGHPRFYIQSTEDKNGDLTPQITLGTNRNNIVLNIMTSPFDQTLYMGSRANNYKDIGAQALAMGYGDDLYANHGDVVIGFNAKNCNKPSKSEDNDTYKPIPGTDYSSTETSVPEEESATIASLNTKYILSTLSKMVMGPAYAGTSGGDDHSEFGGGDNNKPLPSATGECPAFIQNTLSGSFDMLNTIASPVSKSMAVAIGYNTCASKESVGVGGKAQACEEQSNAIGFEAEAKQYSIALGRKAESKQAGISIGNDSKAKKNLSITLGHQSETTGDNSITIGGMVKNTGVASVYIGQVATENTGYTNHKIGTNSVSVGVQSLAGHNSVAIGRGARAINTSNDAKQGSIAIGKEADSSGTRSIAIGGVSGENVTFFAGSNPKTDLNSCTLPTMTHTTAAGTDSIAIGSGASATHDNAVAIGKGAVTWADNTIELGNVDQTVHISGNLVVDGDVILARNEGNRAYMRMGVYGDEQNNNTEITSGIGYLATQGYVGVNSLTANENFWNVLSSGLLNAIPQTFLNNTHLIYRTNIGDQAWGRNAAWKAPATDKSVGGYTISDRRLKNVGEAFTGGLEQIKKLEVFNFTFKDDKDKTPRVGVMAQDLQKIFPDAVTKGEDGYLRIRLEDMFYALVNAVKELDNKVESMVKRVTDNSDRIAALEKQNKELKEQNEKLAAQNKDLLKQNDEIIKQINDINKRLAKLNK